MEEKVKKKTTFWLPPDMIDRMDSWLKADNCRSRNEFVEKALRFYMGYLGTEDNTTYLSQAILTAIQGTLDDPREIQPMEKHMVRMAKSQEVRVRRRRRVNSCPC